MQTGCGVYFTLKFMQLLYILYILHAQRKCAHLTKLITHTHRAQKNHRASNVCVLCLGVSDPMHNEMRWLILATPYPPPAWGCLSLSLSMSGSFYELWTMIPTGSPVAADGLEGKAAHLSSDVEGHLHCMRGSSCLCKVLHVLLPSVHHVKLKCGRKGPTIPTCKQIWMFTH